MLKRIRPASDSMLKVRTGLTRDGQPLSYNRAPCAALAPWIGRLYATVVELPDDYCLTSALFSDVSMIRLQLSGAWHAMTADGPRSDGRAAILAGPHSRIMPISVTGGFVSVGISLRPGTGFALLGLKTSTIVDRMLHCNELGLDGTGALDAMTPGADPEEWLQTLEHRFAQVVEAHGGRTPDPISRAFEALSFSDPQANIADFAQRMDISQRQLERVISRDFGLPPKQVMRRARALDMAAHLRGVADEAEAEELALRYYDQSQMTRDFTYLFGMSPRRFMTTPQAILTLGLESRQAKRLEAIDRLQPGAPRPWQ